MTAWSIARREWKKQKGQHLQKEAHSVLREPGTTFHHSPVRLVASSLRRCVSKSLVSSEGPNNHKVKPGGRGPVELTEVPSTQALKACC